MKDHEPCLHCGAITLKEEIKERNKPDGGTSTSCPLCRSGDRYKGAKDGVDDKFNNIMNTLSVLWEKVTGLIEENRWTVTGSGVIPVGEKDDGGRTKEVDDNSAEEKSVQPGIHGKDFEAQGGEGGAGDNTEVVE